MTQRGFVYVCVHHIFPWGGEGKGRLEGYRGLNPCAIGYRRSTAFFGGSLSNFCSLPEFMNFRLFGKTILVKNIQFGLFLGHPLSR